MHKLAARALLEDLSQQGLKVKLELDSDNLTLQLNTKTKKAEIILDLVEGSRDLYTVQSSQAGGGMGPLLYDLAMEYLTEQGGWMTCDRWGSVSPAANHVWNYFLHKRQDVYKQQLTRMNTVKEIYESIDLIGYVPLYSILVNNDHDEVIIGNYPKLIHAIAGGMIRYPEELSKNIESFLLDEDSKYFMNNLLENEGTNFKYQKRPSLIRFLDVYADIEY